MAWNNFETPSYIYLLEKGLGTVSIRFRACLRTEWDHYVVELAFGVVEE